MARTARKIDDDTLAILTGAIVAEGNRVSITKRLDRPDYAEVDKVLKAAGGVWTGRLGKGGAHVFPDGVDAAAVIDQLCLTSEYRTGADDGWFPTAGWVADQLVKLAGIQYGMRVLEPSAGEGALVAAMLHGATHARSGAGLHIIAVEPNEARNAVLRQLAAAPQHIHDVSMITVIEPCDFLTWRPGPFAFDRVIMNPPFIGTVHLDHVRRAFTLLKQGGRLVSILPAGVKFRQDAKHANFRAWVKEHGEIHDLPDDAFTFTAKNRPSTVTPVRSTGARTVVIVVDKP